MPGRRIGEFTGAGWRSTVVADAKAIAPHDDVAAKTACIVEQSGQESRHSAGERRER